MNARVPGGEGARLTSARAGDGAAFTELLRRHDPRLRGLAFKLLGGRREAMDDVLQDAYLQAFRSLDRFRGDADFGTWLFRIVYNACQDELRRAERRPEPVDATDRTRDRASTRPGPERAVTASDSVMRALSALPVDQRATVLLVDGEGFDNLAAAEVLGVAPGTVASRLSRARATLRTALAEENR